MQLVLTILILKDDFLLRHYDSGECQGKLGHSRASVIWHRAQVPLFCRNNHEVEQDIDNASKCQQVIGIFAGFGILLVLASPVLLVAAPCIICCKCRSFHFYFFPSLHETPFSFFALSSQFSATVQTLKIGKKYINCRTQL